LGPIVTHRISAPLIRRGKQCRTLQNCPRQKEFEKSSRKNQGLLKDEGED